MDRMHTLRSLTEDIAIRSEHIRQNEANLKNLFLIMSDMIFVLDMNGVIRDVNQSVPDVMGYDIYELNNRAFIEFTHDPDTARELIENIVDLNGSHDISTSYIVNLVSKLSNTIITECKIHVTSWNNNPSIIIVARDITERINYETYMNEKHIEIESAYQELKAIEEEIRENARIHEYNAELIRSLCDNVPDLIWAKDIHKRYIFVNQATCTKLLCVSSYNDVIGNNDMVFANRQRDLHPDDATWHTFGECCQNSDDIVMQDPTQTSFYEYGNVMGKPLHLDVYKTPFIFNGELIGTVGCARDITYEKELQNHIVSNENFSKAFFNLLPIPAFYKTPDDIYIDCNDAFCEFYGVSRTYIIGKSTKDLFPDIYEDLIQYDHIIESQCKTQINNDYVIYDKNYKNHQVTIIKTAHVDSNDQVIGIIGIVINKSICLKEEI